MNINNPLSAPQPQHDSFCACFGGRNILICKKSWREFEELPLPEQQQVWADLSAGAGSSGSGTRPSRGRGAPPRTTAEGTSSSTMQTAEPFPASIMASLLSLPAGGETAVVERTVEDLREELYRMQLNHQHRSTNGSYSNDNANDPKASPDSMEALMLALSRSPAYVTNQKLLLKFLRSEHFDVPAAAKRMGRHFHEKRLLFPLEALTRDIRYEDLSANDVDALDRGFLQILRKRDHIGRPVMFYYKALSNCYVERENIVRLLLCVVVGFDVVQDLSIDTCFSLVSSCGRIFI